MCRNKCIGANNKTCSKGNGRDLLILHQWHFEVHNDTAVNNTGTNQHFGCFPVSFQKY